MSILKGLKKMASKFVDEVEALIAKLEPHVANAEQVKVDVLAAIQPHLDALEKGAADAKTEEKADIEAVKEEVQVVEGRTADLEQVIRDALAHLAEGAPADAQAVLAAAVAPVAANDSTAA